MAKEIREYGKTVKRKIYDYEKFKKSQIPRSKRYREGKRAFYADLKRNKPCFDCGGIFHHAAMDFHHHNPDKETDVSKLVYCKKERLLAEIKKCILVCANCHRIRHHKSLYSDDAYYG